MEQVKQASWNVFVLRFLWCACIALVCVAGLPVIYEPAVPQRAASESLVEQSVRYWAAEWRCAL